MRISLLVLSSILAFLSGCTNGQTIETRTHTVAPWQAEKLVTWEKTIETTVAPAPWNEPGSQHRITADGNHLTIRTTRDNQEAILKYLNVMVQSK